MTEVSQAQMQELRTRGYVDIQGEISLILLIDLARRLQIGRDQLCVEAGPAETLRIRVPVVKPIRNVSMGGRI